jgi:hypothetical protein
MSGTLQSPELADNAAQLQALLADAERLVADLDDEAFRWRPEPGRWSISECLEHVSITLEQYAPGIEKCIREGRQNGRTGQRDPKRGWIIGWLIHSLEPPAKRRFKAPNAFSPTEPKAKDEVYPRFVKLHHDLGAAMADADGLDLWKNRMVSPVTSLLRMGLGESFALMLTHGRRHVWQGWQVRQADGFPGGRP